MLRAVLDRGIFGAEVRLACKILFAPDNHRLGRAVLHWPESAVCRATLGAPHLPAAMAAALFVFLMLPGAPTRLDALHMVQWRGRLGALIPTTDS